MGAEGQKPQKAPSMSEMVSEARIRQIVQEEEQRLNSDNAVRQLKLETNELITQMIDMKNAGKEEERRELRNEIVVKNLRLVTAVLQKYGYFNPDKFQNGCIGLLKAAETYDPEKEVPFHNYAAFCIETEVRLAFKRVNRLFESRKQGFLTSLDANMNNADGHGDDRAQDGHSEIPDPFSEQDFDALIDEAETDTLFYDIIIPCIEEYGQRAKNLDMALWRQLEIQYFIELSMENSQRQRLTFSAMAQALDTPIQNIRQRHKKVMELVKVRCRTMGYNVAVSSNGRARVVREDTIGDAIVKLHRQQKHGKHTRR